MSRHTGRAHHTLTTATPTMLSAQLQLLLDRKLRPTIKLARLASSVIFIPFAARMLRMLLGKMISSCAIIELLEIYVDKILVNFLNLGKKKL